MAGSLSAGSGGHLGRGLLYGTISWTGFKPCIRCNLTEDSQLEGKCRTRPNPCLGCWLFSGCLKRLNETFRISVDAPLFGGWVCSVWLLSSRRKYKISTSRNNCCSFISLLSWAKVNMLPVATTVHRAQHGKYCSTQRPSTQQQQWGICSVGLGLGICSAWHWKIGERFAVKQHSCSILQADGNV